MTVYVDPAVQGRGVGARLLGDVRERAVAAGLHKLLARVLQGNAAGEALFDAAGFRRAGALHRHAQVDGRWVDCLLVELLLD